MSEQASSAFALVYEGPRDDEPATLSRIKGAFIADLELSIPQVQEILQSTPAVIKESDDEAVLERLRKLLARAGAKVLIVRQREAEATDESDEDGVFELSLEDLGLSGMVRSPRIESAPVYELPEIDEHEGFESIESEAAVEIPEPTYTPLVSATLPATLDADVGTNHTNDSQPTESAPLPSKPSSEPLPLTLDAPSRADETPPAVSDPNATVAPLATPPVSPPQPSVSLEFDDMAAALSAPPPSLEPPSTAVVNEVKDDGLDLFMAVEEFQSEIADASPSQGSVDAALLADEKALEMESAAATAETPPQSPPPSSPPASQQPVTAPPPQPLVERPLRSSMPPAASESPLPASAPSSDTVRTKAAPEQRPRSRRTLPLDALVTVLVGGVLLGIANWYYFSSSGPQVIITKSPRATLSGPEDEATSATTPEPTQRPHASLAFLGKSKIGKISTAAKFYGAPGVIYTGSIDLAIEPPPERTPEEIVRNVVLPPAVSKIQLHNLDFIRDQSGGYVASGPAKVVILYKSKRVRAVGAALVRVTFPVTQQRLKAYIEITEAHELQEFTLSEEGLAETSLHGENDFRFHFMTSVDAVIEPASKEPALKEGKGSAEVHSAPASS